MDVSQGEMKRLLLLFAVCFSVAVRADELQLDHTFGASPSAQALAFSPDHSKLAVAGSDGVKIYESQTGKLLETREGNGFSTACVAWSPDGKTLAVGGITLRKGWSGEIIEWRPDGTQRRWTTGQAVIQALSFSPDSLFLASAAGGDAGGDRENGAIRLWNAQSGKLTRTFATFYGYDATVAFGPKNRLAFGFNGFDSNKRQVVDLASGRVISQNNEGANPIFWDEAGALLSSSQRAPLLARQTRGDIEWRVLSTQISTAQGEKTVAVFVAQNARTAKRMARLNLGEIFSGVTFGGDLLTLFSRDSVKVWRVAPDSRSLRPLYVLNRTAAPTQLAVSGDGQSIGVTTNRGLLLLDSALNAKQLFPSLLTRETIALSRDGSQVWAGAWLDLSQKVPRRLGSTGKTEFALSGVSVPSPDGQRLVQSGALRFQNGKTVPLEVPELNGDEPKATRTVSRISSASWRTDGSQFVVTSKSSGGRDSDDGFFVFDKMGHFERELKVKDVFDSPRDAAFSPDGTRIFTLSSEENFWPLDKGHPWERPRFDVWNSQTGALQKTFFAPAPKNSPFKSLDLNRLALSPDGHILAASGPFFGANRPKEQLLFFDVSQGQPLGSLSISIQLFLSNPRWAFLDSSRVLILNGSALEVWDWRQKKLLERRFLVPVGDKIRLVTSPN